MMRRTNLVLAFVFLTLSSLAAGARSGIDHHDALKNLKLLSQQLFSLGASPEDAGVGGGTHCAACSMFLGLIMQISAIHQQPINKVLDNFCNLLPHELHPTCNTIVNVYGLRLLAIIEKEKTPDAACLKIGICTLPTCALWPSNWQPPQGPLPKAGKFVRHELETVVDPLKEIWDRVVYALNDHMPFEDIDGDKFSTYPLLRGTDWRGKDCDDFASDIYPGRSNSTRPADVDFDCNGISGTDNSTKQNYEDTLCKGTGAMGVAILGDSAAAHFHLPPQYFNASEVAHGTYVNIVQMIMNEMDWPFMSWSTAFQNSTWLGAPEGPLSSIYMYMRQRNLCIYRDYQNVGVNGARTSSMANGIVQTLARNQKEDRPLFTIYALIGNDVCNGHPGMGHMTTTSEFYTNVVAAMNYLNTVLPMGSRVVFMGLVDGRILWNTMNNLTHPLGIKYSSLYDYLNCLQVSPCWGWLNSNESARDATSERATELNAVYLQVIANNTYSNFDMHYYDTPIPEIFAEWTNAGNPAYELIEPVDGFHPSQIANALIAQYMWPIWEKDGLLPPVNPNNPTIAKLFPNQSEH